MLEYSILFYVLLFVVAFLYASVGHGGASGYLALMALFSFSPNSMRTSAIYLNIIVSCIAFLQYYKSGYFKFKLFWPFAISSIPSAFLGGMISIEGGYYKKILAVLLLLPIIRLVAFNRKDEHEIVKQNIYLSCLIGIIIGLISGIIGIGGGILLSPLILLLRWADMKQTAAVSALFILVNSIAGLGGISINGLSPSAEIYLMVFIATAGGLFGSYLGSKKLDNKVLKTILVSVLLIASIKLFLT